MQQLERDEFLDGSLYLRSPVVGQLSVVITINCLPLEVIGGEKSEDERAVQDFTVGMKLPDTGDLRKIAAQDVSSRVLCQLGPENERAFFFRMVTPGWGTSEKGVLSRRAKTIGKRNAYQNRDESTTLIVLEEGIKHPPPRIFGGRSNPASHQKMNATGFESSVPRA